MSTVLRLSSSVFLRNSSSNGAWKTHLSRAVVTSSSAKTTAPAAGQTLPEETYWDKNKRLDRPMSPHLTIYKPQLTSMLSITHRGTGVALSTLLSGFSIGMMSVPGAFPLYINLLAESQYGAGVIFGTKFLLAFPFLFHTFNGVRHLFWDMGYGFSLRTLYKSGYGVLVLSFISAVLVAMY